MGLDLPRRGPHAQPARRPESGQGSQHRGGAGRRGVFARAASRQGLAEEMPEAYKDVNEVVRVCHGAGISKLVAKLRPLGVMKG